MCQDGLNCSTRCMLLQKNSQSVSLVMRLSPQSPTLKAEDDQHASTANLGHEFQEAVSIMATQRGGLQSNSSHPI